MKFAADVSLRLGGADDIKCWSCNVRDVEVILQRPGEVKSRVGVCKDSVVRRVLG